MPILTSVTLSLHVECMTESGAAALNSFIEQVEGQENASTSGMGMAGASAAASGSAASSGAGARLPLLVAHRATRLALVGGQLVLVAAGPVVSGSAKGQGPQEVCQC